MSWKNIKLGNTNNSNRSNAKSVSKHSKVTFIAAAVQYAKAVYCNI